MNENGFERFSAVNVIGYTETKFKVARLEEEFYRVGIRDYSVRWNFPDPFDRVISGNIIMGIPHRYFNVTIGHYRAIKTARCLGYNSVLICEDDARFLKDLDKLRGGLNKLPTDYDLAMLDSFSPTSEESAKIINGTRINDWWCRGSDKRTSSACYALSTRGMDRLLRFYESAAMLNNPLHCCDQMFEPARWLGLNFYVALPNLAIQVKTPNTTSQYNLDVYRGSGISIEDYEWY